jgi:endoribonuclease Dicer
VQRLEFLGDAVLDHIFTDYFFNQYPDCTPGLLTDLRSASVNNNCYAHAAVKAGLHKHILHSSSALHQRMAYYLENFEQSFSGPSHGWEAGIGLPKVHLFSPQFFFPSSRLLSSISVVLAS